MNILAAVHKRTPSSVSLGFAHAYLKTTQAETRACRHALKRAGRQKKEQKRKRWKGEGGLLAVLLLTLKRTAVIYSPETKNHAVNNSRTQLWRRCFLIYMGEQSEISKSIHVKCHHVCVCPMRLHHLPQPVSRCLQPFGSSFCLRHDANTCHMNVSSLPSPLLFLLDQLLLSSAPSPEDDLCFPAHLPP